MAGDHDEVRDSGASRNRRNGNRFFLNGAREEDFLCQAKILKLGKRLIYGTAERVNGEGKLLTHHTVTYIRANQ